MLKYISSWLDWLVFNLRDHLNITYNIMNVAYKEVSRWGGGVGGQVNTASRHNQLSRLCACPVGQTSSHISPTIPQVKQIFSGEVWYFKPSYSLILPSGYTYKVFHGLTVSKKQSVKADLVIYIAILSLSLGKYSSVAIT